jgi:hypothetical protein
MVNNLLMLNDDIMDLIHMSRQKNVCELEGIFFFFISKPTRISKAKSGDCSFFLINFNA